MTTTTTLEYIGNEIREYTNEMLCDALDNDRDAIAEARRIYEEMTRGFLSAMENQGQLELGMSIVNTPIDDDED